MVVKVRLEGLNVVRSRGRYYVYFRDGGEPLVKAFDGSRADLDKRLAEPDMIGAYNARRKRNLARTYPERTLGWLVEWYQNECPKYGKLAQATKDDYCAAFEWLRPAFDMPLQLITTPSLYELRDRCAKAKKTRFADKMISALSSMFTQGVKRNKLATNPCLGMDRAHTADPNANREWTAEEFTAAFDRAPREVKIPMMLARNAGLRGQTIVAVSWKQYQDDALTGKCFRFVAAKNKEKGYVPTTKELQAFLAALPVAHQTLIAVRDDGTAWDCEKDMQTRVSHYLRDLERDGLIGAGTTLHGLRVSYAAWLKRIGANNSEVAAALGDKSERMGAHYTRHVEAEANVVRAFKRIVKDGS
jgi:hypothetical protein